MVIKISEDLEQIKMTDKIEGILFLIEYFSGIENGDFYEEPVQGEYPDWQLKTKSEKYLFQSEIIEKATIISTMYK